MSCQRPSQPVKGDGEIKAADPEGKEPWFTARVKEVAVPEFGSGV